MRHRFSKAAVQNQSERRNQRNEVADISKSDRVSNQPLLPLEMRVQNFNLFLDTSNTTIEIFWIPNCTKYVEGDFSSVWPVSSCCDQIQLINFCLLKWSFTQKSGVTGLTGDVGSNSVALKD